MNNILFLIFLSSSILFGDVISDGKNYGKNLSNGLKNGLTDKIFNPMISNTTLTTTDGNKSASANLTCANTTTPFAKIVYNGTSDITINIQLDLNLDGTYEKNLDFSGVSQIHTRGVAKCALNSSSNCRYYDWTFNNASNQIELVETTFNMTSGLYCINSSCGSLSSTQHKRILDDVAGVVGTILQRHSANLTISRVQSDNTQALLYGQNYSNCTNRTGTNYTSSSSIPSSSQLANEVSSAQNQNNEIYHVITQADNNEQHLNPVNQSSLSDMKTVAQTTATAQLDTNDAKKIQYTSAHKDINGNWVTSDKSSSFQVETEPEKIYCMVEWDVAQTQVASDKIVIGNGTNNGLNNTINEELRECANNVCPIVGHSERIKYDCGHTDSSFGEVAGVLSGLEEIAKDLSCSSN